LFKPSRELNIEIWIDILSLLVGEGGEEGRGGRRESPTNLQVPVDTLPLPTTRIFRMEMIITDGESIVMDPTLGAQTATNRPK
jgi:hypothetical protein